MYFHHQSLSRPINNSQAAVMPTVSSAKKVEKVPTKEEWRYENVMRMNHGESALSYEEFVSQVKAGTIKL